jgi:hypothetical protein
VRGDELSELVDALLCADGPVTSPVDLKLVAEHRRGHGAMYEALNHGNLDVPRLRQVLAGLPMPRAADGRLVLAVDVSNWLRPDAPTSTDRLFCHIYGRSGRSSDQFIPGWPYSFVAALESGLRRLRQCTGVYAITVGTLMPSGPHRGRVRGGWLARRCDSSGAPELSRGVGVCPVVRSWGDGGVAGGGEGRPGNGGLIHRRVLRVDVETGGVDELKTGGFHLVLA